MNKPSYIPYLILFLTSVFLLIGCADKRELEELAHVVVIGLDKAQGNQIEVTFQISNPEVGSSTAVTAVAEQPSDVLTLTAPDIVSAKELANSIVTRKMNFAHMRTIVIGEQLARTPQFHHIIASSTGDPELRREVNVIVSKEKAAEFIKLNKPKLETRPHKYYTLMQERWRDTGFVPYATVNRYFQRLSGELFLAIYGTVKRNEQIKPGEAEYVAGQVPQKSGDPVQVMGSAVFKHGKMIGTLTGEETRLALMLRRKALSSSIIDSFPDPIDNKYQISVRLLRREDTKIDLNVRKNPPEVHVTIPLVVQILSVPSLNDYVLNLENQKKLKQSIEQSMQKRTMQLIKKTQQKFKGEPFLWNVSARQHFWSWPEYQQYEWEKRYQQAKVQVKVDLRIESFGKQFIQPKIQK